MLKYNNMIQEKIVFYVVMIVIIITGISLLVTSKKKIKPFCPKCGSGNVKDVGFAYHCYKCGKKTDKIKKI